MIFWMRFISLFLLASALSFAQLSPSASCAAKAKSSYTVKPHITYLVANNYEAKLDVYQRTGVTTPQPTLIFIHGGGWTGGTKEAVLFELIPYFEMGWNVVNVEYRLAKVSLAPAAVEDCLCALRWVAAHAKAYGIDANRPVGSGPSAGRH